MPLSQRQSREYRLYHLSFHLYLKGFGDTALFSFSVALAQVTHSNLQDIEKQSTAFERVSFVLVCTTFHFVCISKVSEIQRFSVLA